MHNYFEEAEGKSDPWSMAVGLKRSIEGDWPDHHWAIVGNWRARYLRWVTQMKEMGLNFSESDLSPEEYLETFK